ncbi:MAG: SIS domain-containing protein, partial [Syntrophales bacterium]|nr:SIS domain-containing protein [Syntrophales bacterium]
LQIERYLACGHSLAEAFRLAVNDFEGSQAIAMQSTLEPGKVFLALRGGGQSLYVGLCDSHYVYSSEIYGLVELVPDFIKMDGENERIAGDSSTKGQIFILNSGGKGGIEGIEAFYYDGHSFELADKIQKAEITTRDIDRRNHPHYLLKEILEAPLSMKKTMRGKYRIRNDGGTPEVIFNLGEDIVTDKLKRALAEGRIKRIFVIGQGTAAVAGAGIADALGFYLKSTSIRIGAMRASELSGFLAERDFRDCLVIAVTQSGTTTDTNRAVAMARRRGAHLIAIVNRRQSDITHMVDGVFYTSDGRDIEMSVASTKAFYAQVTAGYILALFFACHMGTVQKEAAWRKLKDLERCPDLMKKVIAARGDIKQSAWEIVKKKRYWAVVGSGPNKVASDEVRIKLSELCYKTISSDTVEDKKHIDLSSEPFILVLAAGNPEPVVGDLVKDVAIFKAHASSVAVITEEGEKRFEGIADGVIEVPASRYPVSVILNTLAGHLWGYYAACSLDEEALLFRNFRSELSKRIIAMETAGARLFEQVEDPDLRRSIEVFSLEFHERKDRGFLSALSAESAADIALLLKYASGKLPLEDFWTDFRGKRVSSSPIDMLDIAVGHAIDELARPIDAVRHQAKTVTVGTSRKEEIPKGAVSDLMRALGFSLENMTGKNATALQRIQKAVQGIKGYTLYTVENLDFEGKPQEISTISITERGGISTTMISRIEKSRKLMGTKRAIVSTGDVYAGLGKSDGAPFVIIPLINDNGITGKVLLAHVDFNDTLSIEEKKEILGEKFNRIIDFVSEYNVSWRDSLVETCSAATLLGESADIIARKIVGTIGMKNGF